MEQPGDNEEGSGKDEATAKPATRVESTTAMSPVYHKQGRVRGASPLPFVGHLAGYLPAYTSPIPRRQQVVVKLQGIPGLLNLSQDLASRLQPSLSRCAALMGADTLVVVSAAAHQGALCLVLETAGQRHQQEQHSNTQQPQAAQQHTEAVKFAGALVSEIACDMQMSGPEADSPTEAYIQVSDVMCVSVLDPGTRTWRTTSSSLAAWAPASQQEAHFLLIDPFIFSSSPPTQLPASLASRYVSLKLGVVLQHLSRSPPSSLMPYRVRGWAPSALTNNSSSTQSAGAGQQHSADASGQQPLQPLRVLLRCGQHYMTTRVLRQRTMCHVLSEGSAPAAPSHAAQLNTIAVEVEAFVLRQALEGSAATAITGGSTGSDVPPVVRPVTVELWQGHVLLDSMSMLCVGDLGLIDPDSRPEHEGQHRHAAPAAAGALIHISDASDTTGLATSPPGAQGLMTTTSLGMATAHSSSTGLGTGGSLGAPLPEPTSFMLRSPSPAGTPAAAAASTAAGNAGGFFFTEASQPGVGQLQEVAGTGPSTAAMAPMQLQQVSSARVSLVSGAGPPAVRPVLPRDLLDGRVSLAGDPGMAAMQWHTPGSSTAQPGQQSRQAFLVTQAGTSSAGAGFPLLFQPRQQGGHSLPFQLGPSAQPPTSLAQQALLGSMSAVYETSRASFHDDNNNSAEQSSLGPQSPTHVSAALDELLTLGNSPAARVASQEGDVFDPAVLSDESEDVLHVDGPDFIQVLDLNSSSPIAVWRPTQQQDVGGGGLSEHSGGTGAESQGRERGRDRQRPRGGTDWDAEELVLDPLDELLLHADRDEAELAAYRHRLHAAMQQQLASAATAPPAAASTAAKAAVQVGTPPSPLSQQQASGSQPGGSDAGHMSQLVGLVLAAHAVAFPADPLKETHGISESSPPSYVFCLGTLHALLAQLQFGSSTADVEFKAGGGLTSGGSQVDTDRRRPETELAWALGRLLLRESVAEGNVTSSKSLLSFLVPLLPPATSTTSEGSQPGPGCGLCASALSDLVGPEVSQRKSKLVSGLIALGGDLGAVRCCMLHHPLLCCHAKQGRGQAGLQPIPEVPEDAHRVPYS